MNTRKMPPIIVYITTNPKRGRPSKYHPLFATKPVVMDKTREKARRVRQMEARDGS